MLSHLYAVLRHLLRNNAAGDLPKKPRGNECRRKAERKLDNFVSNVFVYRNPKPDLVQLRSAARAASRAEGQSTPQAIVKRVVEQIQEQDDDDDDDDE